MKEMHMSSYNVTKIAAVDTRTLLIIISGDGIPMVSVYDEHLGQTLVRMTESTVDSLQYALGVLENGEI
jgi:carbamoylphosphate synthase small subunit